MENKNKDRIIIGLIIAVAVLFANNIIKSEDSIIPNRISLMNDSEDDLFESSEEEEQAAPDQNNEMKVHISGEILNEGVYTIEDGDRLDDLVKKAGGFTAAANTRDINLALKLDDQMKIYIPNTNEITDQNHELLSLVSSPTESNAEGLININTASLEELKSLPNIGEKRAQAIIDYREATPFENIDDIKNVTGIGDKYFESMKDMIIVR